MSIIEKVTFSREERTMMPMPQRLNHLKIMQLNDEEFAQFYLELMTEYKTNDGWWTNGKISHCINCHRFIEGPEQLRRYYGMTLDADCFRKEWKKQRRESTGLNQQYWDRVAQLS
ncbi:MAG: hypothetical protein AABY15_02405 [Nanoarchaeota archaeon]